MSEEEGIVIWWTWCGIQLIAHFLSLQLKVVDFDVSSNRIRIRTAYLVRDPVLLNLGRALRPTH